MRVILSCMDYRLTEEIMKRMDQNTIVLRNAGANVNEFKDILKSLNPDEVVYLPHTDCAAMKLVLSSVKQGEEVTPKIESSLVSQFRGRQFNDLKELEELNHKLGLEAVKQVVPKAKVISELIDVNKLKWPERKPVVYLLKSTSKYTNDMIGGYVIQSMNKTSVEADLEIASKLNLKVVKDEFSNA
ncbi:MAG: carbonic anhydrase [Candidatus Aramenus sp.]|nr:carbonic anhydrase [Candidatus Aramenus sp.]